MLLGLRCAGCGKAHPTRLNGTCDVCGGQLLARYTFDRLYSAPRSGGMWSWPAFMPPCDPIWPGTPATPLIQADVGVYLKDEGVLPTGTFKARGAAVGVAMAKFFGAPGVALPTAGNAGAAWAAACASAELPCAVWAAEDAPDAAISAAKEHGAEVTVVAGSIVAAGAAAAEAARERGWHNAATFREPWRVEGKKTALLEIVTQLGGKLPDAAVLPVGGGVGVVAWHQAIQELNASGILRGNTRLYAVQDEGCAPIARAFASGAETVEAWESPVSQAPGIRIPAPLAGPLVVRMLRQTQGGAVTVSAEQISRAKDFLRTNASLSVLDEAAAAWAGYETLQKQGVFGPGEVVVVYSTGSVV